MFPIIDTLKKGVIVSCQSEEEKGSQLIEPRDIARMGKEALSFGACAIRICGKENIQETREMNPRAIIIGIAKSSYPDSRVLITADIQQIREIVAAGANIVGLDMTSRLRPNGETCTELLKAAMFEFPNTIFMADLATEQEAVLAFHAGVHLVGTTLSGYTPDTEDRLVPHRWYEYEPDFDLVSELVQRFPSKPIIAEGRYRDPEQCHRAVHELGAYAVCVGSQVTRPRMSTQWHVRAVVQGGYHSERA